jgi:integrase
MPSQLGARLRSHLQTHEGKTDLLFVNLRGRPFSANKLREKQLHPLLVKLSIPCGGSHAARHGVTSALLADDATPAVVQKQLTQSAHASRWKSTATSSAINSVTLLRIAQFASNSSR